MSETTLWGRYSELRPHELAAIHARTPVVYLPWGGLTWHGPHLPLGIDTMVAETIAERAAKRTGGVVLPAVSWSPTLPHLPASPGLRSATLRALLDAIFEALATQRWRVIALMSGFYSPGHELLLIDAAEQAMARHQVLVLAVPPLVLVDDEMLDHGALWESSILLAVRPDLVDLDALGPGPLGPESGIVTGRDPRGAASASLGQSVLALAVERVSSAVDSLLASGDPAPLRLLYTQRRQRYHSFTSLHGTDPETITAAWWQGLQKTGNETSQPVA